MRLLVRAVGIVATLVVLSVVGLTPAFADEGLATWYGPGFHGRGMANGQIYDMYDPTTTAANIFPFGTWLKVTNPANGKTVFVQVRDRGGFTHALDLSYAAFAQLDDTAKMWVRVRYEVVPGPPSDGKAAEAAAPSAKASEPPSAPARPPAAPPASPPAAPLTQNQYVVQRGDTLFSIAQRSGVTTQVLVKINGLASADRISVGQVIKLREDAPAPNAGTQANPSREPTAGGGLHRVQPGDTLIGIAKQFGLTVDQVLALNNISDPNFVRAGDELRVSAEPSKSSRGTTSSPGPGTHVVQSGETLGAIALRYGVSEDAVIQINDLPSPDMIVIDQKLRLPSNQGDTSPAVDERQRELVVEEGDTLLSIALEHGTSVDAIVSLNDLESGDFLQIGQLLRLP